MTIYLEMSEKNSGYMNGDTLYDNDRNASWDGDTMNITIKDNGDAMSTSFDKATLVDLLGRSCNKSPLEKRLGRLLTTRRKQTKRRSSRRQTKQRSCRRGIPSHGRMNAGILTRRRRTRPARSCRRPTKRRHSNITASQPHIIFV